MDDPSFSGASITFQHSHSSAWTVFRPRHAVGTRLSGKLRFVNFSVRRLLPPSRKSLRRRPKWKDYDERMFLQLEAEEKEEAMRATSEESMSSETNPPPRDRAPTQWHHSEFAHPLPRRPSRPQPRRGTASATSSRKHKPCRSQNGLRTCASCHSVRTPLWRDAEDGTPLCNACGIRHKKYRVRCSRCNYIPRKEEKATNSCHCGSHFISTRRSASGQNT